MAGSAPKPLLCVAEGGVPLDRHAESICCSSTQGSEAQGSRFQASLGCKPISQPLMTAKPSAPATLVPCGHLPPVVVPLHPEHRPASRASPGPGSCYTKSLKVHGSAAELAVLVVLLNFAQVTGTCWDATGGVLRHSSPGY